MSRMARQLMWAGIAMGLSAAALLYVRVWWRGGGGRGASAL